MKMLKKGLFILVGTIFVLALSFVALIQVASERVEVVELHTNDESGEAVTTRLWVVDDEGHQYLRVGSDGSGWFDRLSSNGEFDLTRSDIRMTYTAIERNDKREKINELMQAKYTWGDTMIGVLVGSREGSIPIELHPVEQ